MEKINGNKDENIVSSKKRHGCVTSWLVMMIISNSIAALLNIFASEVITTNLSQNVSILLTRLLGLQGVVNVVLAVMLMKWKKIGFWGFFVTSTITLVINLMLGIGIIYSMSGLLGLVLLYGILQIKGNGTTAWENLN